MEEQVEATKNWLERTGIRIVDRLRRMVSKGNAWRLVIKKPSGGVVISITMTALTVIGALLVFFLSWIMLIPAAIFLALDFRFELQPAALAADDDEEYSE
ncbi:MAG: DUF4342 domain-containing protein [Spirochaetaceae bacterium]|nr:MAG: DUF4342 domain-containing protein [Spirochaetaceae bacterium]